MYTESVHSNNFDENFTIRHLFLTSLLTTLNNITLKRELILPIPINILFYDPACNKISGLSYLNKI